MKRKNKLPNYLFKFKMLIWNANVLMMNKKLLIMKWLEQEKIYIKKIANPVEN